jgi:O-antigen/teichoic acid export membrane protein
MAELAYHIAIWQHLATISEAQYGLAQNFYGAISLIRLIACIAMIYSLARQLAKARSTQGKPWDFLFETASTYP